MEELFIERLKATLLTLQNIQMKEQGKLFGCDHSALMDVKAAVYRTEKMLEDINLGKICICSDEINGL